MSRLIDADKLIEELKESYDDDLQKELEYLEIYEFIKEQPTAYNVDKVVEQLEEEKMWYETHGVNMDMKKGIIGATCKAIKIVKAGVIDEKN